MIKRILPFITGSLLLFLSATAQPNKKASGFFQKGIEFKNQNKLPEAMTAFKNAIALKKNYDSAYAELGYLFVKFGMYDSAIINFKKALTLNPNLLETHLAFADIYRNYKPNLDSAIMCFMNACKIDSLNKVTLYQIAWCYNSKQVYEKAIYYAVKALDLDNTYRPAYSELAHAYHLSKKYAEGLEQFKKNIAISPVDLAYLYSGLIYTELNQKEDALKMYESLEKLNPKMAASLKKKIDAMK